MTTREQWLEAAITALRSDFVAQGATIPSTVKVSVGWPLGKRGGKCQTIGQAFSANCSARGYNETFISPAINDSTIVLSTLVHELVHHVVGVEQGHNATFGALARKLGLEGKLTATTAGAALQARLNALAQELGEYPHASMSYAEITKKKQSTRLLKVACPACGYTVRVTAKWTEIGLPTCCCGEKMTTGESEGDND
jgi:hypothetical protein